MEAAHRLMRSPWSDNRGLSSFVRQQPWFIMICGPTTVVCRDLWSDNRGLSWSTGRQLWLIMICSPATVGYRGP